MHSRRILLLSPVDEAGHLVALALAETTCSNYTLIPLMPQTKQHLPVTSNVLVTSYDSASTQHCTYQPEAGHS
jgi:hypothetical protein